MSITTIGVTLRDVIDAGLEQTAYSSWHDESRKERWCWHASALSGCPRKSIMRRAKYQEDPRNTDSMNLLAQAKLLHQWLELCSTAYCADVRNDTRLVVSEVGYVHPTLNLTAMPDLVLEKGGRLVLVDYKTEKEGAMKWRKAQARENGTETSAKPEHRLQLAATAMVLEADPTSPCYGKTIEEGRIWYLSRQEWFCDEQPVDLADPHLRQEVTRLVAMLDACWENYAVASVLPHRMPADYWMCRPRKAPEDIRMGKYCELRSACYHPRMPG